MQAGRVCRFVPALLRPLSLRIHGFLVSSWFFFFFFFVYLNCMCGFGVMGSVVCVLL